MFFVNYLQTLFSGSSSSSSSTSSLIEKLNKNNIVSCVLAMSKINLNNVNKNFAHAALLLIDTDSDIDDDYRGSGIVIEYGDYSPNMSEKEKEDVKKGTVIYRYGDKGGLRYYAIDYKEYLRIFGDICYVSMDIKSQNQMTFQYFLDQIAPKTESVWIQEKYRVSILNEHNCQVFVSKAIKLLKPYFRHYMIVINDKSRGTKKRIDILPSCIKEALQNL